MPQVKCPVCQKLFEPATSAALPFCCERCRTIDLGRWLGEAYSVPVPKRADDEPMDEGDES